jgi:hypothetical protein
VLPPEAAAAVAEVAIEASPFDAGGVTRDNTLRRRVDVTRLGEETRVPRSLTYAVPIDGPISEVQAAGLVLAAVRSSAIANGYLDPRPALTDLQRDLNVAARPD